MTARADSPAQAAYDHVLHAFQRACAGEQVVVTLPPGTGKTFGTLRALQDARTPLKVLWFMPETHDRSLAATTETNLRDLGVSCVRIHQVVHQSTRKRQQWLSWPEGIHVKLLAHAYLPLLFGASPVPSLHRLQEADLVIIDENPFGSLLSLSGTPADQLQGHRTAALPLELYLEDLHHAGVLATPVQEAHAQLTQAMTTAPRLRDDRQRDLTYLNDDQLSGALRPLLTEGRWDQVGARIAARWRVARSGRTSPKETRLFQARVRRLIEAVRLNLKALMQGEPEHGVSLVRFPESDLILVRNARLERLEFGRRGVLHLDAFPSPLLVRRWLPLAQVLPAPAAFTHASVRVNTLVPEHAHDIPTISRKAVTYRESHARHHAVIQQGLKVLGPRVVILAHQHLAKRFQAELAYDYAPHTAEVRFLYWRANLGLNEYAGWDALIVNESRLPRRVLHLDYTALSADRREREALLDHLEASDFLQLLHRIRPLTHGGQVLLAFDPVKAYRSPLVAQNLTVTLQPLQLMRGKSEHVLALQAARIVVEEALRTWEGVPLRLLHLLFGLHPGRSPEPWDQALVEFLDQLKATHRSFEWLALKPNPADRQDRALIRLLKDEYGLTGHSRPIASERRGRPLKSWVWTRQPEEMATEHATVRAAIERWHERDRSV